MNVIRFESFSGSESISLTWFDNYIKRPNNINMARFGHIVGVYGQKQTPNELRDTIYVHTYVSIFEAKIPSVRFVRVEKAKRKKRNREIYARLKFIHSAIRPYRNKVYDAIVDTPHYSFSRCSVRDLYNVSCARGDIIFYEGRYIQIQDSYFTVAEICDFVKGVHKQRALLGCIQALEQGSFKMFERRVLSIVKEFM